MSPEIDDLPGRERMRAVLALAEPARQAALDRWAIEHADATLIAPIEMPVMPYGAREHASRLAVAERMRERAGDVDEAAAAQHTRWIAELHAVLFTDGTHLAHELLACGEFERAAALGERLQRQVLSLEALGLDWWPHYAIERDSRPLRMLTFARRAIDWIRSCAARRQQLARRTRGRAEAAEVGTRLVEAGFDHVLAVYREPEAFHGARAAFHGEDLGHEPGRGEIVAPGADLSEPVNDDSHDEWEVP